jgi:hypothetical protein
MPFEMKEPSRLIKAKEQSVTIDFHDPALLREYKMLIKRFS